MTWNWKFGVAHTQPARYNNQEDETRSKEDKDKTRGSFPKTILKRRIPHLCLFKR